MSKRTAAIVVAVISLSVICSCRDQAPTASRDYVPFVNMFVWDSATSPYGYLSCVLMRKEIMSSQGFADVYQTIAVFYDSTGQPVVPFSVTLNGVTVPIAPGHKDAYTPSAQDFSAVQHWVVTPSASVPAISDSIAPPSPFRLTYPVNVKDTVSKSSLTITYEDPGVDSVYVVLKYDGVLSHALDSTIADTSRVTYIKVPNTGSYTVPSTLISGFPSKGSCRVIVVADRTKVILENGHKYMLRSCAAASAYFEIKA